MANPRKIAVTALLKIYRDSAYSNLALGSILKEYELSVADKALVSALVYGVLDRCKALDYVLSRFMKTPIEKTAPFTLNVLRTALYQIMFMDKIPESAAVNEAVKLVKNSREARNAGFVNGVLRSILRSDTLLPEGFSAEALSVRFSCPEWMVNSFLGDYGCDTAVALLEESLKPAPFTVRVNTLKTDTKALKAELSGLGITCKSGENEASLVIEKGMDIADNRFYKEGFFYAQDLASQKAVAALSPKPGERMLDMCAAPGGKSFTAAMLMENRGEIIACDLYEARVGLIAQSAKRLGLRIIKPAVNDATVFNEALGEFDCVLCDVPCSGLGVIRRKPEIKYKGEQDFSELADIQYRILCNAVRYLKPGGRILYSTCTLRKAENELIAERFLKEHGEFCKVNEKTLMPHIDKTDGFYYALFQLKN
ncbi:MAG: 16S rRNA (cytosine(967)-C(5))-methyltransferase RsmB [Clostridia bacterium]|nr:16S rRNA (cytosine(967)-C(5))-methyltransferase RsmB [Clostridia bacterium]